MKLKLIFSLLLGATLLPASTLHLLTITTPDSITQTGPYADYGFFYSILPFLQDEVLAGRVISYGYIECSAPCNPAPPIYRDAAQGKDKTKPSDAPESSTIALLGLGLLGLGLVGKRRVELGSLRSGPVSRG